jgi:uncharacterized protein
LSETEPSKNVEVIRQQLGAAIREYPAVKEENIMKKVLFELAYDSDIVLDLHCDSDAVVHMYTHDRLWPALSDLAAEIQSECQLLAPAAGGNPFDEACSCPWADLADKFPSYPIPMACEAVTVELRGESDVSFLHYHNGMAAATASIMFLISFLIRCVVINVFLFGPVYRCTMIWLSQMPRRCSVSCSAEALYQHLPVS